MSAGVELAVKIEQAPVEMLPMTRVRVLRAAVSAVAACACLSGAIAVAQTPSLAEVARREQERRKVTGPPVKVLTNDDLPAVTSPAPGQAAAPATAPEPAAAPAASSPPAAGPQSAATGEEKEKEKDEAYWRGRIGEARASLQRNEVLAEALQSRVNALSTDFVNRDDPYQRARIGDDRLKALAELERVQAEVASLKQEIADIEEEARRAGVPPGWLR
jgi:hypothetical protein